MTTPDKAAMIDRNQAISQNHIDQAVTDKDILAMMDKHQYTETTRQIITSENLLPSGLLSRLHLSYSESSCFLEMKPLFFTDRKNYSGLSGFREVCDVLKKNSINIPNIKERELFIKVYRFLATRHSLNAINWNDFENDSIYQLIIPQPGMIDVETTQAYVNADSKLEQDRIVKGYAKNTNPHDANQLLNKPWFAENGGKVEFLEGSQHKYPQCQLVLDRSTQSCFSFCTYCFRHAQVRGDEDMFQQEDPGQIHRYLKQHTEVTDLLLTGGDAGLMSVDRLSEYVMPLIHDPGLHHIRTVRLGTRALTYQPEMILGDNYTKMLKLFDTLYDNGIQLAWMAHFSTPRELLNPSTIAAIRRLKKHGVMVRSQSPIMHHISLFKDKEGRIEIERSAQNWIDLANILSMLGVGFHSMYCARPTGEHHYFSAPLADIEKIFSRIYRSLSSINRPSRHISMTISAGKVAIVGTTIVGGKKCFALKFTEARNMEWMDRVFLARYDEKIDKINLVKPFDTEKFFFEDELEEIERELKKALDKRLSEHS